MNEMEKEAKGQWEDFRKTWSIEKLNQMTIKEYYSKNDKSCFCKMLESTKNCLGAPGGWEPKYGIWEFSKQANKKFKHDQHYAWTGDSANSDAAFAAIKEKIKAIARSAQKGNLEAVDKIEFAEALKWKIAFMYQPSWDEWCIYPVCDKKWQRLAARNYDKTKTCEELQRLISERKKLIFDGSCYEFYQRILIEKEYCDLIENNKQIILHGAPGTGKTHLALTVLAPMLTKGDKERIKTVQFHPGYDYSDFIVGLKPKLVGEKGHEQVSFEWRSGIFKTIAEAAKVALDKAATKYNDSSSNKLFDPPKYVLVIDEINRADLSNVFGEVFSRMERGYRYGYEPDKDGRLKKKNEEGVELPSTKNEKDKDGKFVHESLVIPDNLYIIGTMNDIDRSVESMDFALRRRFAWRKVRADDTKEAILSKFEKVDFDKLSKAMKDLNDWIRNPESRLGESYELGAAIFAQLELYRAEDGKYNEAAYKSLWDNHLSIILREYLRGQDADGKMLERLKIKYDGKDKEKNADGGKGTRGKKNVEGGSNSDETVDEDDVASKEADAEASETGTTA